MNALNGASSVRTTFTQWGECIDVASMIGSVACVVVAIFITGGSAEPMFAKVASVIVLGILPGLALLATGIAARAVLWTLGFLHDRAEPHVRWGSAKIWKQSVRFFSVIREWSAKDLPRYWSGAKNICEQGKKGLLAAPGMLFSCLTAPIRFAARTALTVAKAVNFVTQVVAPRRLQRVAQ